MSLAVGVGNKNGKCHHGTVSNDSCQLTSSSLTFLLRRIKRPSDKKALILLLLCLRCQIPKIIKILAYFAMEISDISPCKCHYYVSKHLELGKVYARRMLQRFVSKNYSQTLH